MVALNCIFRCCRCKWHIQNAKRLHAQTHLGRHTLDLHFQSKAKGCGLFSKRDKCCRVLNSSLLKLCVMKEDTLHHNTIKSNHACICVTTGWLIISLFWRVTRFSSRGQQLPVTEFPAGRRRLFNFYFEPYFDVMKLAFPFSHFFLYLN